MTTAFEADQLPRWLFEFLAAELLVDGHMRLEQAGARSDQRVALAAVFVDLDAAPARPPGGASVRVGRAQPFTREMQVAMRWRWEREPHLDEEDAEEDPENLPPGFLAQLAKMPVASTGGPPSETTPIPYRLLLTGGPGWGKSTLGQMLCQVYRAKLLSGQKMQPPLLRTVQSTLSAATSQQFLPTANRLPLRVVLTDFAAWLAEAKPGERDAVSRYLAARVLKRVAPSKLQGIDPQEEIVGLLTTVPCLLVFDGLDEVAETAGRSEVVSAILSFLGQFGPGGPCPQILLTSRPSSVPPNLEGFEEWRIQPMSRARALRQAMHLVAVRHPADAERQQEVADRLGDAWSSDVTRALFRVPLHVALTVVLADAMGRLPEERWRLFDEHYRVLYQRELEKPTEAAAILREHRPLIDAVHQRAALLLQVETERAGGSRSTLSRERLSEIVDSVLEEEIDEPERSVLLEGIVTGATERLVLLARVEENPDQYGFELRSLQEFFAAEAMFVGREAHVVERLTQIAFVPAFRNVVLFAASKLDGKPELWHLREGLVEISGKSEDLGTRLARAELALDLLEDGFPRRSKKLQERLVYVALDLLSLPPGPQLLRMTWTVSAFAEPLLRARIEQAVSEGRATSMAFWLVVVELADSGLDWAVRVGDEHWPADAVSRREILRHAVFQWARLGPWLGRKLGAAPEDFPPWFVLDILRRGARIETAPGDLPSWLESCLLLLLPVFSLGSPYRIEVPATLPGLPKMAFSLVRSTEAAIDIVETDGDEAPENPTEGEIQASGERPENAGDGPTAILRIPESWLPFAVTVSFAAKPAPELLAGALAALAPMRDLSALRWAEPFMPWILRMCLRQAGVIDQVPARPGDDHTSVAIAALGAMLHETPTLFGTSEDWGRAEKRWSEGITLDQLGPTPWPPVAWDGSWFPADAAELASERLWGYRPQEIGTFLDNHFPREHWTSSRLRAKLWLALLLTATFFPEPFPHSVEPHELTAILDRSENRTLRFLSVLPLRIESSAGDAWPAALDRIARTVDLQPDMGGAPPGLAAYLAEAWVVDRGRTGLLRWLAELVNLGWQPRWGLVTQPIEHGDPQARLDAWAVFLAAGFTDNEAIDLARAFAAAVPGAPAESFPWFGVPFALRQRCTEHARRNLALSLLMAMREEPANWAWHQMAWSLASQETRVSSGLDDRATWARLDLPLPLPWRPPSKPPPVSTAIRVKSIVLHDIRLFGDMTLPIEPPADSNGGQWIVLLGENAVGKSTVLRAVALALLDPTLSAAIVKGSSAGYLTHDASQGRIEITTGSHTLRVALRRDWDGTESLGPVGDAPRPTVFGYGCRRGSALGGAARAVSFTPGEAVATLYDEGASLIHAETWLKERAFAAAENSREKVLFDEVKKALIEAMPGIKSLDVKPDGVWLYGSAVGRTRLGGLSDGYLTMMGWIIDLIARWTEREERRKTIIEPGFLSQMEGVVLLDELDLHLHPRWQVQVIDKLRGLFPRMTFIVTTHNPLTLLGARKGEVIVLRRREEGDEGAASTHGQILARQQDLRPGLTVDEILTGAWFGLATTLDEDTLRLLETHRKLLREGRTEEDAERLGIEAELRRRLGRYADTSLERLAQTVAARLTPRSLRDLSAEEREQLARKVRETVAVERMAASTSTKGTQTS